MAGLLGGKLRHESLADPDFVVERIGIGPVASCHCLVNDHDRR
jgi:hypothetical protein